MKKTLVTLALSAMLILTMAGIAQAQTRPIATPTVGGVVIERQERPATAVRPSVLPFTGGQVVLTVVLGLSAAAAGSIIWRRARKTE